MEQYEIIKKYLLTEKTTKLKDEENKYTFAVDRRANKIEIGKAVEKLFKVKVVYIHVMNMPGKRKRMGRIISEKSPWKKAIVTLAKGERIEIIEGV